MKPILIALLTVLTASPAFPGDHQKEVFAALIDSVESTARGIVSRSVGQHAAPRIVVASHTADGANLFVREWLIRDRGRVIGLEMAESFETNNSERHELRDLIPARLPRFTIEGPAPAVSDWEKLEVAYPGANMLIVFSKPAFDSLSTAAVVRVDYFPRSGGAETQVKMIERAPSGRWSYGRSAHARYKHMHSEHGHIHLPEDAAYYHEPE